MTLNLRSAIAQHLDQRLVAFGEGFRQNLALIGLPGSGKTFQLEQLIARAPSTLTLIYCPIYRESCRSFLQRWLGIVLNAAGCSFHASLEVMLQEAQTRVPKTAAAIRLIEPLLVRRLYGEAFIRVLDTIPLMIEERGRPCVLILDEFLHLEDLGLAHAFHELGKRVMIWPSTLFILASSSPYRARAILRERLQLLFGQFELVTLEALEGPQASTWLHQELRGLRGAKPLSLFLLRWLDGYPWHLSLLLKRLKELAAIERVTTFTEALFLKTAWDLIGNPSGPLHQWCVLRTEGLLPSRGGARAMDALLHIAMGARTTTELGQRIGRGGISSALQLLVERDLAQRNGTCWMVPDPILRCWLSTVASAQRAETRVGSQDAMRQFEAYLRALWQRWEHARALSFSDQVAALFSQFSDDTVLLDSKAGRLPRFETIHTQQPPGLEQVRYLIAEGEGKRWCAFVHEGRVDEPTIARFETFCKAQAPKPARKVVIASAGLEDDARVLAKTVNMWVWERQDLQVLMELYGAR